MNFNQKQEIQEQMKVIETFLDAIQSQWRIGTWEFGTVRHQAPSFGFTLFLYVFDPQNKIRYQIHEWNHLQPVYTFHILDDAPYSEMAYQLDMIANKVKDLDLRQPSNKTIAKA